MRHPHFHTHSHFGGFHTTTGFHSHHWESPTEVHKDGGTGTHAIILGVVLVAAGFWIRFLSR